MTRASIRPSAVQWAWLAKICLVTGVAADHLTPDAYRDARAEVHDAVVTLRGHRPKSLSTPPFDLDAVMFHRGQAPPPDIRRRWTGRPVKEVTWEHLSSRAPVLVTTLRRHLDQCRLTLRPSSVACFDTIFRQFAATLVAADPPVVRVADITREHIESYKHDLSTRPGHHGRPLSKTTLAMRVGHLHTFFTRIIEWDYDDVPARIPVYSSDRPRLDKPLPKFLDDAQAVAFMNAARNLPDPLERLVVIALARTGMRRGELLGLSIDAVVQIGTGYWLRTPVGKLHTDRYIPLHPQFKDLLDDWVAARPGWQATSLLLTDRGRPIPPTRVDNAVQKAATAAGIGHVHPHQLRHTLATQAINRGMSLEAIAALLGHHDLSMTRSTPASPTGPSPRSTSPSPPRSKPSTTPTPPTRHYPPKRPDRTCAPSATRPPSASSATATAADRASWTVATRPSANPARCSSPPSSTAPPSKPNATTPHTKDTNTGARSTTPCSTTSTTTPLDTDHPHMSAYFAEAELDRR